MGACSSSMGLDRTGLISIAEENTDDIGAEGPPGCRRCSTALQTLLGLYQTVLEECRVQRRGRAGSMTRITSKLCACHVTCVDLFLRVVAEGVPKLRMPPRHQDRFGLPSRVLRRHRVSRVSSVGGEPGPHRARGGSTMVR